MCHLSLGICQNVWRDGRRDAVMNYLKGDSDILDSLPLKSELVKTDEA